MPGPPPDVGEVVLEDPLTAPGAVQAWRCPTGRNLGEFVGEGYLIKVTGKCSEAETQAVIFASYVNGLLLRDGEPQPLPPKALDVLIYLGRHAGRPVGKGTLLKTFFGGAPLVHSDDRLSNSTTTTELRDIG